MVSTGQSAVLRYPLLPKQAPAFCSSESFFFFFCPLYPNGASDVCLPPAGLRSHLKQRRTVVGTSYRIAELAKQHCCIAALFILFVFNYSNAGEVHNIAAAV